MDGWSTVKGLRYRISSWAHSWTPTQLSQILQGGVSLLPPGGSKEAGCGVLGQCSVSTFNPLAGQSWTTTQCSSLIRDSALTRNDAKWILNINKHASTSITAAVPTAPHADEWRGNQASTKQAFKPVLYYNRIPLHAAADIFALKHGIYVVCHMHVIHGHAERHSREHLQTTVRDWRKRLSRKNVTWSFVLCSQQVQLPTGTHNK